MSQISSTPSQIFSCLHSYDRLNFMWKVPSKDSKSFLNLTLSTRKLSAIWQLILLELFLRMDYWNTCLCGIQKVNDWCMFIVAVSANFIKTFERWYKNDNFCRFMEAVKSISKRYFPCCPTLMLCCYVRAIDTSKTKPNIFELILNFFQSNLCAK